MKQIILATLLTALATTSLNANANEKLLPAVLVHKVQTSDLTPTFKLVGRIEATQRVNLLARVSGFLEGRLFTEGRDVEADQVLFKVEKANYEIALKQAEADLASARAGLKNAQTNLNRVSQLRKRKAASQSQFDQAVADRDQSRAQVLKAEAGLKKAELNLSYTEIKAPFSGRIGKANFSVGDLISPESGVLATVVKIDEVYVEMAVSEKLMLDARRKGIDLDNPPVAPRLILSDGSVYEQQGQFDFISPEVDPNTDTITLRASFENPKYLLLPGEFVHVEIKRKQPETGIQIPQSAVQRDRDGYFVLEVDQQNKVTVTRVEMGPQVEGQWQVLKGLDEDDLIITEGLQKVKPGIQVNAVAE
ncbi:efflux RND transporter periplasmic adaptor subunit [Neptuniibacter sp. SY11_33]|uniref:efflux RND transporter periplasmic adaptor subunit n=1 Tax=Neptuniibacter sp. SY11_33 TaxID=3398215 RepID=UPI0039F54738